MQNSRSWWQYPAVQLLLEQASSQLSTPLKSSKEITQLWSLVFTIVVMFAARCLSSSWPLPFHCRWLDGYNRVENHSCFIAALMTWRLQWLDRCQAQSKAEGKDGESMVMEILTSDTASRVNRSRSVTYSQDGSIAEDKSIASKGRLSVFACQSRRLGQNHKGSSIACNTDLTATHFVLSSFTSFAIVVERDKIQQE